VAYAVGAFLEIEWVALTVNGNKFVRSHKEWRHSCRQIHEMQLKGDSLRALWRQECRHSFYDSLSEKRGACKPGKYEYEADGKVERNPRQAGPRWSK